MCKVYDGLGQLIQTQTGGAVLFDGACSDGAHNPDWCDIIVDKEYDTYGNLSRQTVPLALSKWGGSGSPYRGRNFVSSPRTYIGTVYDAVGRPTTVSDPDGTSTLTSYPDTPESYSAYNEMRLTDARSNTTRSLIDVWGHTPLVIPLDGDYDGRPIQVTDAPGVPTKQQPARDRFYREVITLRMKLTISERLPDNFGFSLTFLCAQGIILFRE